MSARRFAPFKLFGTVSLGLLTGMSYTLSINAVPALLTLPSASTASNAFAYLSKRAVFDLRTLSSVSAACFLSAYAFSPRGFRHPYLLWTSLIIAASGSFDLIFKPATTNKLPAAKEQRQRDKKGKGKMEASYEVLGDSHSEGTGSASDDGEEDVNGEEVRSEMESFKANQTIRFYMSGLAFIMSIVGIWGDGAW